MYVHTLHVDELGCEMKFTSVDNLWTIRCMYKDNEFVSKSIRAPYKFRLMTEIICFQPEVIVGPNSLELKWTYVDTDNESKIEDGIELPIILRLHLDRKTGKQYLEEISALKQYIKDLEKDLSNMPPAQSTSSLEENCPSVEVIEKTGSCLYRIIQAILKK